MDLFLNLLSSCCRSDSAAEKRREERSQVLQSMMGLEPGLLSACGGPGCRGSGVAAHPVVKEIINNEDNRRKSSSAIKSLRIFQTNSPKGFLLYESSVGSRAQGATRRSPADPPPLHKLNNTRCR